MKKKGSISEYREERDRDLFQSYKQHITEVPFIQLPVLIERVVKSQAPRFYVSEERAAAVITALHKGKDIKDMRPSRQDMYREIYRRFVIQRRKNPHLPFIEVVSSIISQPAPEFYLTVGSAIVIIHRIKHHQHAKKYTNTLLRCHHGMRHRRRASAHTVS